MGQNGERLTKFMCGGAASALVKNTELFWAGLERLEGRKLMGEQLTRFMCDSTASALVKRPDDFLAAFDVLRACIGTDGMVTVLRNNNQLASRFTPAMAASLARVAVQAEGYGLDGGDTLRTIVNKSIPMIKKIESLATHVESLTTKATFVAFVKSCKGDAQSKRNLVANTLPLP